MTSRRSWKPESLRTEMNIVSKMNYDVTAQSDLHSELESSYK